MDQSYQLVQKGKQDEYFIITTTAKVYYQLYGEVLRRWLTENDYEKANRNSP